MSQSTPSLVRGSSFMLVSMVTAGAVSFLISLVIARLVGVEEFGVYSILISIQNTILIFAVFGLSTAIAKYVSEYNVRDKIQALKFAKTGLTMVLLLGSLAGLVYFALAGFIGNDLYHESRIVALVPFSALVVLSSALLAVVIGTLQGCQKIGLLAVVQITVPAATLGLVVVLFWMLGMRGIFLGYFVSQLSISLLALTVIVRGDFRFLPISISIRRSPILTKLFAYAVPAFLASVLVLPIYWIGNTVLALDEGFDAMGYFAVAFVIFQSLIVLPNAIVIPLIPKVSELTAKSLDTVKPMVAKTVRIFSITLFPVLFGIALFSHWVVGLLYGSKYEASVEVAFLMVSAAYFYALAAVVGGLIAGVGRMWLGFAINLCWGVVFILTALLLVPVSSVRGLGGAFSVSYLVLMAISFAVSRRSLGVDLRSVYLPAASASVFFLLGFLAMSEVGQSEIVSKIVLYIVGLVYFVVIGRDAFAYVLGKARALRWSVAK